MVIKHDFSAILTCRGDILSPIGRSPSAGRPGPSLELRRRVGGLVRSADDALDPKGSHPAKALSAAFWLTGGVSARSRSCATVAAAHRGSCHLTSVGVGRRRYRTERWSLARRLGRAAVRVLRRGAAAIQKLFRQPAHDVDVEAGRRQIEAGGDARRSAPGRPTTAFAR